MVLLFFTAVVPGVVLVLTCHADGCFGSSEGTRLGTVGHGRSRYRTGSELDGVFIPEAHIALCIAGEATLFHRDTDVRRVPGDICVAVSDTAELTGFVDFLTSLTNGEFPIREGDIN